MATSAIVYIPMAATIAAALHCAELQTRGLGLQLHLVNTPLVVQQVTRARILALGIDQLDLDHQAQHAIILAHQALNQAAVRDEAKEKMKQIEAEIVSKSKLLAALKSKYTHYIGELVEYGKVVEIYEKIFGSYVNTFSSGRGLGPAEGQCALHEFLTNARLQSVAENKRLHTYERLNRLLQELKSLHQLGILYKDSGEKFSLAVAAFNKLWREFEETKQGDVSIFTFEQLKQEVLSLFTTGPQGESPIADALRGCDQITVPLWLAAGHTVIAGLAAKDNVPNRPSIPSPVLLAAAAPIGGLDRGTGREDGGGRDHRGGRGNQGGGRGGRGVIRPGQPGYQAQLDKFVAEYIAGRHRHNFCPLHAHVDNHDLAGCNAMERHYLSRAEPKDVEFVARAEAAIAAAKNA